MTGFNKRENAGELLRAGIPCYSFLNEVVAQKDDASRLGHGASSVISGIITVFTIAVFFKRFNYTLLAE